MTSPTMEGALAEIAAARRDRDAEMWRAGAEAMREAAAVLVDDNFRTAGNPWPGRAVRSLDIPETPR